MARLEITLLGSPWVTLDGRTITHFRTAKVQGLLAYLAVEAARPHLRTHLMSLLWPEASEANARQSLRAALYQLRKILRASDHNRSPEYISADRATIQLNPDADICVDVCELIDALQQHNARRAINLYQGELLAGFSLPECEPFELWLRTRREELHRRVVESTQRSAQHHFDAGDHTSSEAFARRLLEWEPWREETHYLLMQVLQRTGQRGAALAHYERCRQVLATEMGLEPSAATTALYAEIRAAGSAQRIEFPDLSVDAPTPKGREEARWIDWGEAGQAVDLYGREAERALLQRWIAQEQCRVVGILGMGGIGKTALATAAARGWIDHFQVIFWRSLRRALSLEELLREFLQRVTEQVGMPATSSSAQLFTLAFEYLQQHRCLLVLDNVESILLEEPAGEFRSGFESYAHLFERMAGASHESCLLFTSREQFQGLIRLQEDQPAVRVLPLAGLPSGAAQAMMAQRGLAGEAAAELAKLADAYSGNPLALKLAARTIIELFGGQVRAFLATETLIFGDLRQMLDGIFARLSEPEQALLYRLAAACQPLPPPELIVDPIQHWPRQVYLEAMRSLQQRVLLDEPSAQGFAMHYVVNDYVAERLVDEVAQEIERGVLNLFQRIALCNAQALTYVRDTQIRTLLAPLATRLLARHGQAELEIRCRRLLTQCQQQPRTPGYAAGNLLNLLISMGTELDRGDFSQLCVWQAYLADVNLRHTKFTGADLRQCVFAGPFGVVYSVALSPDETRLAAGAVDGEIYLWNAGTGQPLDILHGHRNLVRTLVFSRRGHLLASGDATGMVQLWDAATYRPLGQLMHPDQDVQCIAITNDDCFLLSSTGDGMIYIWSLETLQPIRKLQGDGEALLAVVVSPDGRTIVASGMGSTLYVWDFATGNLLHRWQAHSGAISSLAIAPQGDRLATGGSDGKVRVRAMPGGELLHTLAGHTNWIWSLAYHPDGHLLVSAGADESVRVWDMQTGSLWRTATMHTGAVRSVDFGSTGQVVASGSVDRAVCLWDMKDGRVAHMLQGYLDAVTAVACSPNGDMVASGSANRTIQFWYRKTGQLRQTLRGHSNWVGGLSFSPDGLRLASSSLDHTVRIWDVKRGTCLRVLRGHTEGTWSVAFSPAGDELASGSEDGTIRLWDPATGQARYTLLGHDAWVDTIAYHPQGDLLVSAGADATVRIWDLHSRRCIQQFSASGILRRVIFSRDAKSLFVAGDAGDLLVWNLETATLQHVLHQSSARLWSLAASPTHDLLAAAGDEPNIKMWRWDGSTFRLQRTLRGHKQLVMSLAFTPDGATLVSGSIDGTVRYWSVADGQLLCTAQLQSPYAGMDITDTTGLTSAQRTGLLALGAVDAKLGV